MKEAFFCLVAGMALLGFGAAIGFFTEGSDVAISRVMSPLREEVRRRTFEHSRAYREGLEQELQSLQISYSNGSAEQKAMIGSTVLHRTASVNLEDLPYELQTFVRQIRSQRGL